MTDTEGAVERQMPRGKRKGGTKFPRYGLDKVLPWAKKLVSKTHNAPLPREVIYSGVVGSGSGTGDVKISALKQYGLLEGSSTAYSASQFGKKVVNAPEDEARTLYAEAVLKPHVFSSLYITFQGDEVTRGKLKQRAAELHVHPDELESCIDVYSASLVHAGLATIEGDKVIHAASDQGPSNSEVERGSEESGQGALERSVFEPEDSDDDDDEGAPAGGETDRKRVTLERPGAVINVTINIDSTLDVEKLERQLKLLRRYGAL